MDREKLDWNTRDNHWVYKENEFIKQFKYALLNKTASILISFIFYVLGCITMIILIKLNIIGLQGVL